MQKRLLIVGAGLTGSMTASFLEKSTLPLALTVWDKARGAGGRMSTHRDHNQPNLHVDMGAQYISRTEYKKDSDYEHLKESLYEDLLSNGILIPFCGSIEGERFDITKSVTQNYVSPGGLTSVVKHFLLSANASISFQHQVMEANIQIDKSARKIACSSSQEELVTDCLILTLPVPQFLHLKGNFLETATTETLSNLSSVKYSSRYALGLFYKEDVPSGWSARYFDDPIIRFASWDTIKRGCTSYGSSLLLHTSVPFGIKHLEDKKDEVEAMMIHKASELIPALPPPSHTHLVRWRYSQVSEVYPESPGCVVLSRDPLVVATGDGFSGSNFENCIKAAHSTAITVIQHFQTLASINK